MDLYVSGINKRDNEDFTLIIDSDTAIEIINDVEANKDDEVDARLMEMDYLTASVYDSLTYIRDVEPIVDMLERGDRFAIMFTGIDFGISGQSFEDAKVSLNLQEF